MERREEEAGEKKDIRKRKLKKSEGEGGQSQERRAQVVITRNIHFHSLGLLIKKRSMARHGGSIPLILSLEVGIYDQADGFINEILS